MRWGTLTAGAVAAAIIVAGCGSAASSDAASTGSPDAAVRIVASTNVYGDIAHDIAGDHADVTSIIADPDVDPHSYEANAQNQLALSKADLVIENGGGYDDFMDTMLHATKNAAVTVINAVDLSGFAATQDDDLNEHVWYDFPTVARVADAIETALARIDPPHADLYHANAARFDAQLTALEQTEDTLKAKYAGTAVAITEPVPLYLLQAIGLDNKTPAAFSEAVEEGDGVSPAVLKQTLDLVTGGQVKLVAYNEQATSPETEQLLTAARAHDVAVVPVTETLPATETYLSWMKGNLAAVTKALA